MTEIPEHLLKRSKERRAALGLPGGEGGSGDAGGSDAGAAAEAPAAVAKAAPAAPAKVEEKPPPPPKPKPAYILAAERRQKIPYWAMPVLVLLPVWAILYTNSIQVPEQTDEGLAIGEEVYASCQGCHGATGGGGTGAPLSDGHVLETFPDPVAMMEWIHLGAEDYVGGASGPYGDPEREGGAVDLDTLPAVMPGFADLSPEELAGVTRYIRETLSGEAPASPEVQELYEQWAEEAIENAEAGEIVYKTTDPDPERIELVAAGAG